MDCCIVVPTFQENENLEPLITRVFAALKKAKLSASTELIVVDDNSQDGSQATVERVAKQLQVAAKIIVRTQERGLSSAVVRGFEAASAGVRYLLCMDADLQHPPESVPAMISAMKRDGAAFVLGTRYGKGVNVAKDWPLHRRVISAGARSLAWPLSPLSDPMSGFFGVQASVYAAAAKRINPIGYKIALEVYVKAGIKQHAEVPINFGTRVAGESKLSSKVIVNYLLHLYELYSYSKPWFLPLLVLILLFCAYWLVKSLIS